MLFFSLLYAYFYNSFLSGAESTTPTSESVPGCVPGCVHFDSIKTAGTAQFTRGVIFELSIDSSCVMYCLFYCTPMGDLAQCSLLLYSKLLE